MKILNLLGKAREKKGLIGLVLLGALALQPGASAEETYHLRCRGGGDLWYQLSVGISGIPDTGVLFTYFNRSTNPNPMLLEPGQCSWEDRLVSRDEPTRLCHYAGNLDLYNLTFSYHPTTQRAEVRDPYRTAPYIERLKDSRNYQGFWVWNDRLNTCLRVMKID